jgi:hypothetical protein
MGKGQAVMTRRVKRAINKLVTPLAANTTQRQICRRVLWYLFKRPAGIGENQLKAYCRKQFGSFLTHEAIAQLRRAELIALTTITPPPWGGLHFLPRAAVFRLSANVWLTLANNSRDNAEAELIVAGEANCDA